jgi:hypothetical protein
VSGCDSLPAFIPAHRDRVRSQSHDQLPSFARETLRYLLEYPEAQDTVEGIMVWWVSERAIKHWLLQVRESLASLVARGYLEKQTAADGRVFYRLNQSRVPHKVGLRK